MAIVWTPTLSVGVEKIDSQDKIWFEKMDYKESGGNITLIINANQMIVDWLTKHILTMDKKIDTTPKPSKNQTVVSSEITVFLQ